MTKDKLQPVLYEVVGPAVQESDKRPRSAMAYKDGLVYLITTKTGAAYTLP